jgi:hypothetical protein
MMPIGPNATADIFFQLKWNSRNVGHSDAFTGHMVNFWRDLLHRRLYDDLMEHETGDRLEWRLVPVELTAHGLASDVRTLKRAQFDPARIHADVLPRPGRFYPKGILADVANVFAANREPFRCLEVGAEYLRVDMGHPLGQTPLTLNVTVGR